MIARTNGVPITTMTTSEVEGTSTDNWQNISSRARARSARLPTWQGKKIAVNALKGVGEVMIRAALEKLGIDPNSVKLLGVSFPACEPRSGTARSRPFDSEPCSRGHQARRST